MSTNEDLYDDASLAINELFSDQSVDVDQTAQQLRNLRAEIDALISTLEEGDDEH